MKKSLFALLATATALSPLAAEPLIIAQGNLITTVDSATPGTALRSVTLGLPTGELLVGIDSRPAQPRVLYGVSNAGNLYRINAVTGATQLVGNTGFAPGAVGVGFDFNPTVDRIRLTTANGGNFRVNPDTAALTTDGNLAYAPGDPGAGLAPRGVGAAYTNNRAGATSTTLYVIEGNRGALTIQGNAAAVPPVSPNTGQLNTVGQLQIGVTDAVAFDISASGATGAVLTIPDGRNGFFTVNLQTGVASFVGQLPTADAISGLTFTLPTLQSYGLTANGARIGAILDENIFLDGAQLVGDFLDAQPNAAARNQTLLLAGTPIAQQLVPQLTFQSIEWQDNTVRKYLRDVRGGGVGNTDTAKRVGSDRRVGFWLQGSGRFGSYDAGLDRLKTNFSYVGVAAGADVRLTDRTLIGVYGGYDDGRAELTPFDSDSAFRRWFAGAYGSASVGPVYLDAHGFYSRGNNSLQLLNDPPEVGQSDVRQQASTSPDTKSYGAVATAGLSFDVAGFEAEPYVGARFTRVDVDRTSPTPGGGISFGVGRYGQTSLQSIAGLRIGGDFKASGVTIRPSIRGEYRHEFRNNDRTLNTVLQVANDPVTNAVTLFPTTFRTNALAEDYADVGAGLTISGTERLSFSVEYTGQFGEDRQVNGVTGGLRLSF